MFDLLAQAAPPKYTFFGLPPGSQNLTIAIIVTFVVGVLLAIGLSMAPTRLRRPITWFFTFLAGGFYVLMFLYPTPIARQEGEIARNPGEQFSFWLEDALPKVADVSNILAAFLLGLGIFSLLTIHITKVVKKQKDYAYSIVLLVGMLAMSVFGYADYYQRSMDKAFKLEDPANWGLVQYGKDLLFNGFVQQMDAAMFSIIAFFILSAAYRAFRVRSVEATILMATALIMILSIMGAVDYAWGTGIDGITGKDPASFLNNFKISEVANWIKNTLQVPSLRALDFGVGLGALAMGLRLWLGLEKGVRN